MFACLGSLCRGEEPEPFLEELNIPSGYVTAESWETVPEDVLQAVLPYLHASDVQAARLTCRNWRLTLSADILELRLPLNFLSSRGAAAAMRRASKGFPSLRCLQLWHANGWCDPVQARMNLEPMVRVESRLVNLDPLAAALPQLPALHLQDATFTRDPWLLGLELRKLPGLRELSVEWDTALWAPGQMIHEWAGLQGIFSLTRLEALSLHKCARLFLGETPLGDAALASAAALRALRRLELSTVKIARDGGLAPLALLPGLTRLALSGHVCVSLGALARVFGSLTRLEELDLGQLVPTNEDLAGIVAAHRAARAAAAAAAAAAMQGSVARSAADVRGRRARAAGLVAATQLQRLEGEGSSGSDADDEGVGASGGFSIGGRGHTATSSSGSNAGGGGGAANEWGPPTAVAAAGARSTTGGKDAGALTSAAPLLSPSAPAFSPGEDWSIAFAPLQALRHLTLHSDLALLGSCAALRGLPSLSDVQLQAGAKFLEVGAASGEALPASWLHAPEPSNVGVAVSGGEQQAVGGSSGGWPALRRLQVDGLQLADGLVGAVARLSGLRTLIVSGPCLLAHQPLHQMLAPALAAQLHAQLNLAGAAPAAAAADQQQQVAAAAAAAAVGAGAAAAPVGARGGRGGPAAGGWDVVPEGEDHDLLTRLSPLTALERFELHTQPQTPQALHLSDYSLSHLLICWTALTSLHFDVRGPCSRGDYLTAPPPSDGDGAASHGGFGGSPLTALVHATNLKYLSINLFDIDSDGTSSNGATSSGRGGGGAGSGAGSGHAATGGGQQGGGSGSHRSAAGRPAAGGMSNAMGVLAWGAVDWGCLPPRLESLSLSGFLLEPADISAMARASPGLRHLRLLLCHAGDPLVWRIAKSWPDLNTLVLKEPPGCGAGLGNSGASVIAAALPDLRSLAVTLLPRTDVSPLGALPRLEHLLLDGRSNAEVLGWAGLCRLTRLRSLVLPLLQMQHDGSGAFTALQAALRGAVITNVSSTFGVQHGCQWFAQFGDAAREWWRSPASPWEWHPLLTIRV